MAHYEFDLLIAGAGPAGCTLALNLAEKGLRIGIIDKDFFPRHKICGDALSGKVVNVMKRLPAGIYKDFVQHLDKIPSWGIRFTAPNFHSVDIPFMIKRSAGMQPPGYVCRRNDFDNFLFGRLKDYSNIYIFQGERITELTVKPDCVQLKTMNHEFRSKVIAGADGVHSTVRKFLSSKPVDKKHFCIGIRAYYENVSGLHPENFIELIFLKELLPGYFWIFPSTQGQVNAGFGMMQSHVVEQKENLTHIFNELITNHPLIAPRFKDAKSASKAEAHTLPLGTYNFNRSGNRYVLLGDAAFLVDPFSGEGIGNAMASGEIAAAILTESFRMNDFSTHTLNAYDVRIKRRFSQEFKTETIMQRIAGSAWLFNMVVDKARKNKELSELLTTMFTNEDVKKKLTQPGFYASLLFK